MGREVRRVPPDWEHPKERQYDYCKMCYVESFQPLFNRPFADKAREWLDKAVAWDRGEDPDCAEHKATHPFYWQWAGMPPDERYYRPDWPDDTATHYQVYETVSEGTPVTPHFATKAELVDWLVEHGDEWDEQRTKDGTQASAGWPHVNAEAFVERAWAPSMVIAEGKILTPRDGLPGDEVKSTTGEPR